MDLVDLIQEKRFIGQEFLAWLWYKSEERGGSVEVPGIGDILVVFEKHMLLEYGEGDASETLICRGLQTELREARAALKLGKKPEQARIMISKNDFEYHVTLSAGLFEFRNVKLPKTVDSADEGDDQDAVEGRILERISLLEELTGIMNELYRMFLTRRVSDEWSEELLKIRNWIAKSVE